MWGRYSTILLSNSNAANRRTPEDAGSVDIPPRPPETKEMIESKLIPCERCGTVVAMLIFAPNATDPGHFEDYACKMYPHYNHLNAPTWILGPALGEGPPIDSNLTTASHRGGERSPALAGRYPALPRACLAPQWGALYLKATLQPRQRFQILLLNSPSLGGCARESSPSD